MNDFRFANPNWGHAVWLVIGIIALLLWLDQRGALALNRFLSPSMQSRLALRSSSPRRWAAILCLGLAAACLVVALMRPQWGLTFQRTPRIGAQIMICLDVSRSMLAEDTAPNRLERAKAEILDMLAFLEGDQVGLIAFAGKASVSCPLTPDFGFFRLILDDAGPHSVGLGGTILSAPLRKALDGFRGDSEASRVMMLITDGEDHAPHAGDLEQVAKLAAERGIKVIAIGFGDEQGSQIQYTDPATGGRMTLRDADGNEVVTRLDGETLRDLALTTEGVYIPAGTGLLDLESIYDAHMAPLVRGNLDDRGRAVRRDVFQWAILSGLLLLLLSIGLAHVPVSPWSPAIALRSATATAAVFAVLMTIWPPAVAAAVGDSPLPDASAEPDVEATADQDTPDETGTEPADLQIPQQPRQAYNVALARLDNDLDAADQLLTAARRQAGADGEVRYRATYNLGWLEIHRADRSLSESPHKSLEHLHAAADWFRDAIRLRPESDVARHNLEVVLRRALRLADSLNQQETVDLTERLDQLIGAQRELLGSMRKLVEKSSSENDPHIVLALKSEFRELAVQQRQLLSDSDAVAAQAISERDAIMSKKHDERTAEERLRAAQLKNLQHHFFQAIQRMGQTRSQLRRKQSLRAYRRATAALSRLKRARDQLRNPVERLSTIITDAGRLAREIRAYGLVRQGSVGPIDAEPLPAWLDQEYLEQEQTPATERTEELAALWDSMLATHQTPAQGPTLPGTANEPVQPSPEAVQLLDRIRSAKPLVSQAVDQFQSAGTALKSDLALQAYEHQLIALAALVEARELFLDLKQTIELAYAEERRIQAIVAPEDPADVEDLETFQEMFPLAAEFQRKNIERGTRIGELIDESLAKLPATMGPPTAQQADQQQASDASRQQLQTAQQLLELALANMRRANHLLDTTPDNTSATNVESEPTPSKVPAGSGQEPNVSVQPTVEPTGESPEGTPEDSADDAAVEQSTDSSQETETDSAAADLDAAADGDTTAGAEPDSTDGLAAAVSAAVDNLQALRRLFYSIVEHLRETADRQTELNDETEAARTPADTPLEQRLGPLVERQSELAQIAEQIAGALQSQAAQVPESADGQNDNQPLSPDHQEQAAAVSQQLEQAGQLVGKATDDMQSAAVKMSQQQSDLDSARNRQDQALEKLAEAIALLEPPQQQQNDDKQQQQQDQQQDQQDEDQQNQAQDQPQVDPRRLLQAVRDREAQRRREKSKQGQIRRGAVEKDW